MKKHVLTLLSLFTIGSTQAQFVQKIKADSVRIYNDNCNAELILENATRGVSGFLFNKGNGRTEFRKGFLKLSDSTFLIGLDTLKIKQSFTGITSLTTTGSSGPATFASNVLNIPNYTIAGLGGQSALNGSGFVKMSGTSVNYDNSTYVTTSSASALYQPLENQRLSTSNSPVFNSVNITSLVSTFNLSSTNNITAGNDVNAAHNVIAANLLQGGVIWSNSNVRLTGSGNDYYFESFTGSSSANGRRGLYTDGENVGMHITTGGNENRDGIFENTSTWTFWNTGGGGASRYHFWDPDRHSMFLIDAPNSLNTSFFPLKVNGSIYGTTESLGENSTKMASTAFVKGQSYLTTTTGASTYYPISGGDIISTTGLSVGAISTAAVRIGNFSSSSGTSLFIKTPSDDPTYASGLAIDGSYASGNSSVNIRAIGSYRTGGYAGTLNFYTTTNNTQFLSLYLSGTNAYFGGYVCTNSGLYSASSNTYLIPITNGWRVKSNSSSYSDIELQTNDGITRGFVSANNTGVVGGFKNDGGSYVMYMDAYGNETVINNVTAAAFNVSSDLRLKNVTKRIKSADGIDYIEWKWKEGKDKLLHSGYGAQDVQLVLKDKAHVAEDGKMSISIQEVQAYKIMKLEEKINSLEKLLQEKR